MAENSTGNGPVRDTQTQLAGVEFEVLMEYQRQVIKKYGSSRVSWFLSAAVSLAESRSTAPNDAMKSALEDFEQFIKDVEENIGPVPPEDDQQNDSDTDLLDGI
ncbi:MAG: hypothetical protein PVI06_01350 [Desulfobacterales bacterium]|jgi:hypothetical protein